MAAGLFVFDVLLAKSAELADAVTWSLKQMLPAFVPEEACVGV